MSDEALIKILTGRIKNRRKPAGTVVRELRERLGADHDQQWLADELGVPVSDVQAWEDGTKTIHPLATTLISSLQEALQIQTVEDSQLFNALIHGNFEKSPTHPAMSRDELESDVPDKYRVAVLIRQLREAAGMTREQVSEAQDDKNPLTVGLLIRWETTPSYIDPEKLMHFADVVGVTDEDRTYLNTLINEANKKFPMTIDNGFKEFQKNYAEQVTARPSQKPSGSHVHSATIPKGKGRWMV